MSQAIPTIPAQLNDLFPAPWLRAQAHDTGAVQRCGKVDIVVFFWALALAPLAGASPSLASLQRLFEAMAQITLNPSAYLKRFSNGLVRFLAACAQRACVDATARYLSTKLFAPFREVLAIDSTLIKLDDSLQALFPGPRTNSAPAVAKVHAVYSVISGSIRHVSIHRGKTAEVKVFKLGKQLCETLLLADLGYFRYAAFAKIADLGGYFISRMKRSANPVIVADRYHGPGRTRDLVGMKLWDALEGLQRDTVDLDIEALFSRPRRPTKTDPRRHVTERRRFRVVGVRHPQTGELHVYLTNLAPEQMTPEQIRVTYSARWLVELLFDELKNFCGMTAFPSARPAVVRALIYLAVIRLCVSRTALRALQRWVLAEARQRPECKGLAPALDAAMHRQSRTKRFTIAWSMLSVLLLPEVLRHAGIAWGPRSLERLLLKAMLDPNRDRDTLIGRLEALR